ncbi:hypothetical protein J2Z69_003014 [Paenibacillus shirakamiensis]|uniref:BioF2-like acetyltransferase domain-containing protein n=1 Tax=Paenibacillus shirakamiensis TaxID=1265935 RepID=A0ABS4JJS5_9BACL|nr:hypothetical protein [Paenibacillus shirakamiensis]MBP2001958.1 hypothetical protein [Paenibacillus shirakamiensis]
MYEPSLLERWAAFNREKWGCSTTIHRFQQEGSDSYCESLFFLNKKGKLYLPPLNSYHPTLFHPTNTAKSYKISTQWHEAAELLMRKIGSTAGTAGFCLPPEFSDIRPFLWEGYQIGVKYTYYLDFPYAPETISGDIRSRIRRAESEGYTTRRTTHMGDVYPCLLGTEARQGFTHQLLLQDLERAQEMLGAEAFRCYVCYSPHGQPVSTNIVLLLDSDRAQSWVAGSLPEHLSKGVVQQLQHVLLQDISSLAIKGIDLAGANIRSVAKAKAAWGAYLIPYFVIQKRGWKDMLRSGWKWWQFYRNMRQDIVSKKL